MLYLCTAKQNSAFLFQWVVLSVPGSGTNSTNHWYKNRLQRTQNGRTMIVIEKEGETTFLNDKAIIDCTFDHQTGRVRVRAPEARIEYFYAVTVTYIPDGHKDGVVEREVNNEIEV